jgi:membrane protein required for colicin V production
VNSLDWIFIVLLLILGIRCMVKGFAAELLSVAAPFLGLLAALVLYKNAAVLFVGWGLAAKPPFIPGLLGFAAVFLLVFLLAKLIGALLRKGIEAAELGGVDKALGLLLGLAEGLVLISIVLVVMSLLEPAFKSSAGYAKLLSGSAFARFILPIIGPEVAKATQGIKLDAPELKLQLKAPAIKKP